MTNVGVNPNSTSLTHEESDIPRRSKRARVVKDFGSDFVTYNIEDDPVTFKDAMASSEAKQWKEAVKNWWPKVFKQKEGIDYFDNYSLVARLTTIRVLIALASVYNLSIYQMDVKTAFLYGELEEEIYMDQPEGFVAHGNERKGTKVPEGHSVASHSLWQILLLRDSDASWIAKNSGSNGCSGYVFTLGGGAVSWKSAKQTLITRSTFEAELCALDMTGTEAEWLFGLLSQLPIVSQPLPPIVVHCDSQTTIAKVRSRKYNQKTKRHIQVRLKSIRALVSDRVIVIDFVGTKDNVADPLTKGLDLSQVNKSRLGMGLKTHQ
ncbi:UNVERIFIED_CONTAM: Retrovirus-related Pol polyprotein from transposon TNT 1-94 [Sesamum calycinum]|uniref:Retrovirus-related Pol polyprotein from transposon TNT 1-94 n=1 Tax=Sesamum calycinum TaxID=2727403 RepID=A0AAW2K8X1_9LAMI